MLVISHSLLVQTGIKKFKIWNFASAKLAKIKTVFLLAYLINFVNFPSQEFLLY